MGIKEQKDWPVIEQQILPGLAVQSLCCSDPQVNSFQKFWKLSCSILDVQEQSGELSQSRVKPLKHANNQFLTS